MYFDENWISREVITPNKICTANGVEINNRSKGKNAFAASKDIFELKYFRRCTGTSSCKVSLHYEQKKKSGQKILTFREIWARQTWNT